ncbi:MAG: methyltransferase domain-containing protein [Anaerolineales bacterium]|nr:methyltransferase domain-containing protein [Anaerolineales bacterium]
MSASRFTDSDYLRNSQYRDDSNLNARANLHARFSTNAYGWLAWQFDQFNFPVEAQVLELSCGPASLWVENVDRLPSGVAFTLSDLSAGMVARARDRLMQTARQFCFLVVDAQSIPFPDGHFDIVSANHMLYHVPDRARALAEIARVLRPDGVLYAATNGDTHLAELHELVNAFDPGLDYRGPVSLGFSLENGTAQLEKWFSKVEMRRYEDALEVTEARPLVDYVLSMNSLEKPVSAAQAQEMEAFFQARIDADGAIHISKAPGTFIAVK